MNPLDAVSFTKITLFTDTDGYAKWREDPIPLAHGTPAARLSGVLTSSGYQLRQSPAGFRSEFHCTTTPQWVFILSGRMGIGLRDGTLREFTAGAHFYSADQLPPGASFDPQKHGHWSCALGDEPLITLFVQG